jgi:hypothetical protein
LIFFVSTAADGTLDWYRMDISGQNKTQVINGLYTTAAADMAKAQGRDPAPFKWQTIIVFGDVDMYAVMAALVDSGYKGPVRSDHGRMIWGETGRPAYGLYDRALGIAYLHGLYEGVSRGRDKHGINTEIQPLVMQLMAQADCLDSGTMTS